MKGINVFRKIFVVLGILVTLYCITSIIFVSINLFEAINSENGGYAAIAYLTMVPGNNVVGILYGVAIIAVGLVINPERIAPFSKKKEKGKLENHDRLDSSNVTSVDETKII